MNTEGGYLSHLTDYSQNYTTTTVADDPTAYWRDDDISRNAGTEEHQSLASSGFMSTSYVIIGCFGVVGNMAVITIMLTSSTLRQKMTNIYITNQSALDLAVSIFLVSGATVSSSDVPYKGLAGDLYCKLWVTKVLLWGLLISSTYNLVALTIERYIGVVYPIWHKTSFTKNHVVVSIVAVWFQGLVYSCCYMIPTSGLLEDGSCGIYYKWPSTRVQNMAGILTVIIMYFIPLGLLVFCYAKIVLVMQSKMKVGTTQSGPVLASVSTNNPWQHARQNTIKTLLLVATSFILCWSCNQVYFTLFNLGFAVDFSSDFYHMTVIAVFCNCCVNPFIYALKYEQFQNAAKKIIFSCIGLNQGEGSGNINGTSPV